MDKKFYITDNYLKAREKSEWQNKFQTKNRWKRWRWEIGKMVLKF